MSKLMETFRTVVAPGECDHLGHMNVQHYFAAVSNGMFSIMNELGLGLDDISERQMSFVVVHAESNFKKELVAGDAVRLMSKVGSIGTKSVTFLHQLERVKDGAIAFETSFKGVLLDLKERQSREIPSDIRQALETLHAE